MMLPIQLNDMQRGSGKTSCVIKKMASSKLTKAICLVPNQMQKRYILNKTPSLKDRIFTFEEFLHPEFMFGRREISKLIIDEGLNQREKIMFGVMYKAGQYNLSVEIFGTTKETLAEYVKAGGLY